MRQLASSRPRVHAHLLLAAACVLGTGAAAKSPSEATEAAATEATPATLLGPVSVHAGPGLPTDIVTRVPGDTDVRVLEARGAWRRIAFSGDTGWVRVDHLRLTTRPEDYRHRSEPAVSAPAGRLRPGESLGTVIRRESPALAGDAGWSERRLTAGPAHRSAAAERPGLGAPEVGDEWMLQVRTPARRRPDASSPEELVLDAQSSVRLVAHGGRWYLLRDRDGRGGWVPLDLLEPGLP